jgi:hypothetical protein
MKMIPKIILLAMGCFLAGFVTHSWLTPQRPDSLARLGGFGIG